MGNGTEQMTTKNHMGGCVRWAQTKIKDHLYPAKAGSGADLDTFPTFPAGWVGGWVSRWAGSDQD